MTTQSRNMKLNGQNVHIPDKILLIEMVLKMKISARSQLFNSFLISNGASYISHICLNTLGYKF